MVSFKIRIISNNYSYLTILAIMLIILQHYLELYFSVCPTMQRTVWVSFVVIVVDAKGSIREIILPKGLDLDRPKRTRTSFTAEQLYRLEMEFQRCQYVVGRERTELARQLNLSETQVGDSFSSSFSVFNIMNYPYLLSLVCS